MPETPEVFYEILVEETFTTARVDGRIVAVLWGAGREYFVSDGTGAAMHCGSRDEATRQLMRITGMPIRLSDTITKEGTPDRA